MFHSPPLMVSQGGKPVGVNYTMKRGNVIGALLEAHERHLRLWSFFRWAFMPVKQTMVTGNKLLQMSRPVVSRPNKNDHLIPLGFSKRTDCREDECKSTFCWTSSPKKLWEEVSGPLASISACIPVPIQKSTTVQCRMERRQTVLFWIKCAIYWLLISVQISQTCPNTQNQVH